MMQHHQSSDRQTGGRRIQGERREYTYACCIPERRSGKDRRRQGRITPMMVAADEAGASAAKRSATAMD
jgi:hypothetical protein